MKRMKMRLLTGGLAISGLSNAAIYVSEFSPGLDGRCGYVELYNSSDTVVPLKGWRLRTGDAEYAFEDGGFINPGATLVVSHALEIPTTESLSGVEGKVVQTPRMDWRRVDIRLYDPSGRARDSVWSEKALLPQATNLYRDSVELTYDGIVELGDCQLKEGEPTPGSVPEMTERRKSHIHFIPGEEDGNYTYTMFYDVKRVDGMNDFPMDQEDGANVHRTIYDCILTRPNPVKTRLYVSIADPTYPTCKYMLQDALGMVVARGELFAGAETSIDMTGMNAGAYVLLVEKEGVTYPFKIQKK